jgi:hypothetical protein
MTVRFLRVVVAYAISMRNMEGLTLRINGEKLQYRRTVVDGNVVYETGARHVGRGNSTVRCCSPSRRINTDHKFGFADQPKLMKICWDQLSTYGDF